MSETSSKSASINKDTLNKEKGKKGNKEHKIKRGIFIRSIIHKKVFLPFQFIGSNLLENIKQKIIDKFTGKCCKEGYIENNSIEIVNFSSGVIDGNNVIFDVVFECLVCKPLLGQIIKCKVKNITKAGIRAQYVTSKGNSPVTVYLARDNHFKNEYYNSITESKNQNLKIKVIGVRYELNDTTIYVLGELLRVYKNEGSKQKLKIANE